PMPLAVDGPTPPGASPGRRDPDDREAAREPAPPRLFKLRPIRYDPRPTTGPSPTAGPRDGPGRLERRHPGGTRNATDRSPHRRCPRRPRPGRPGRRPGAEPEPGDPAG